MNMTAYKGFNIETVSTDGLGIVTFRFYVIGEGFNPSGYPSMGHAKGAITKAANAAPVEALPTAVPAVNIEKSADYTPPVGWTTQRNAKGEPVHGNPKLAHIYAQWDYHGMTKARDTRSRNKREGRYAGKSLRTVIAGKKHKPYHFRSNSNRSLLGKAGV